MKHKWLKVLMLAMMAGASFGGAMNPKEIEDLMHIMNQVRQELNGPCLMKKTAEKEARQTFSRRP